MLVLSLIDLLCYVVSLSFKNINFSEVSKTKGSELGVGQPGVKPMPLTVTGTSCYQYSINNRVDSTKMTYAKVKYPFILFLFPVKICLSLSCLPLNRLTDFKPKGMFQCVGQLLNNLKKRQMPKKRGIRHCIDRQ